MQRIYLDNNATTITAPEVKAALLPFLDELYGNPSSLHRFGAETRSHLADALDALYDLIDADDKDSIVVNSCGTEGNNTVLQGGYYNVIKPTGKNHIVTTEVEHPSVRNCCKFLQGLGVEVTYVPTNREGFVTAEAIAAAMTGKTGLASVM